MVITVDGPAGAGKSTISTKISAQLGFQLLDTGAMYRAITHQARTSKIEISDSDALANFACECKLDLVDGIITINGKKVGSEIRSPEVTADVHYVADNLVIRKFLVGVQREIGQGQPIVAEGRDQGTIVFPKAFCKFYLTASDEVRARRRVDQLTVGGLVANFTEVLEQQRLRDRQDQTRPVGKLMKALDAITINTDRLSQNEVVEILCSIAQKKQARGVNPACC